ncbi:MAG: GNAT family N-acetyltransferase, partial [Actinocrinis sp.]
MLAPTALTFRPTELRTGRLLLRPPGEQDIEPTVRMYADKVSKRWLAGPQPYTLEEARRWCTDTAHLLRAMGDGIHWAITLEKDKGRRFLGGIGVKGT